MPSDLRPLPTGDTRRTLPPLTPERLLAGLALLLPVIALMWVSSYARTTPRLDGVPFFYWYQLLWVILSALMTGLAYVLFTREERQRKAHRLTHGGEQA
jgi:membrane protein implicated in regulation of membrane protease activity